MYSYKLVSDDGAYQEVRSFASDSDAIEYVKGNFILFGSLRMTLNHALIYRSVEEGSEYYLAAAVKMSTRELMMYYPIGYWTSDQDEQQEAEQNENQSEEQTEDQSEAEQNEDQSEDRSEDHFLHVETVYQLACLDTGFRHGLRSMYRAVNCPYADDPIDYFTYNYGYTKGCLDSLFYNHKLDLSVWVELIDQLNRLHDMILERLWG